ncbi:unnamed protein product [Tuber aestivum]|uniref:Uncharacterized protein n=1 Tax=Tuber aestivum TaxID=59557 RepID=A0A292PTC9_9PEZI|nr:unnamed protein product [Tuber aestivum]
MLLLFSPTVPHQFRGDFQVSWSGYQTRSPTNHPFIYITDYQCLRNLIIVVVIIKVWTPHNVPSFLSKKIVQHCGPSRLTKKRWWSGKGRKRKAFGPSFNNPRPNPSRSPPAPFHSFTCSRRMLPVILDRF